jgi:hypothetical protein
VSTTAQIDLLGDSSAKRGVPALALLANLFGRVADIALDFLLVTLGVARRRELVAEAEVLVIEAKLEDSPYEWWRARYHERLLRSNVGTKCLSLYGHPLSYVETEGNAR